MGFTNKYPYTDFHELNADWIIEAATEAKETADSFEGRVSSLETDVAPIKAAMPGIASSISDLTAGLGRMSGQVTANTEAIADNAETIASQGNQIGGLDTRVTALENQPGGQSGITEYLRFGTSGTPIDWDARITYTYLDNLIATTASADKTVNIILIEDDELGSTWYYTLNEGEYQISAGTPRGQFTFVCRKPVLDGNNVVTGYKTCTVTVNKNAATPTYTEVYEALPAAATPINITGATNITIISNRSKRVGDTVIIDFSFSTDAIINANDFIVTTQFIAPGNAAPNFFVAQSNVPVSQRMLLNVNGYLSSAESIAQGVTIVVNYSYEV